VQKGNAKRGFRHPRTGGKNFPESFQEVRRVANGKRSGGMKKKKGRRRLTFRREEKGKKGGEYFIVSVSEKGK